MRDPRPRSARDGLEMGTISVQFLESSVIGLRSAVYELVHPERADTVILLPMVHIGTPDYYAEVSSWLSGCSHVVFEGVRTPKSWLLSRSYSLVARRRSLGLVTQRMALDLKSIDAELVHGDVDASEFDEGWRHVPWMYRAGLLMLAPLYGLYQYLFATRGSLAEKQSVDDLPPREQVEEADSPSRRPFISDRDNRVITVLEDLLSEAADDRRIAVVWGAGHMPAIAGYLMHQEGFRVERADWVGVL